MYDLKPDGLYMIETMTDDAQAMARAERMVNALGRTLDDVVRVAPQDVYDLARQLQKWPGQPLSTEPPIQHQRPLVFTRIVLEDQPELTRLVSERPEDVAEGTVSNLLGFIQAARDTHSQQIDLERNQVCWNTQDFGVMVGCPHGCRYCGFGLEGRFVTLGTNIEEFCERAVRTTIAEHPGQKCFRMIGWAADIIAWEPEYDVYRPFLTTLADYADHYGYFHTASDNVDWVRDVPHRDRLIGVWSMTCDPVSELIEPAAPSNTARIEAAAKCRSWNVPTRLKFKPVIPVRGWREGYAKTIAEIFRHEPPETIGFCVIMWLPLQEVGRRIPLDQLDPEYVEAARAAEDRMKDVRTGPFPPEVRAEIYRFLIDQVRRWDKDIPLYISTESREMWAELQDELGQKPGHFRCGCNPVQLPGGRLKCSDEIMSSTWIAPEEVD